MFTVIFESKLSCSAHQNLVVIFDVFRIVLDSWLEVREEIDPFYLLNSLADCVVCWSSGAFWVLGASTVHWDFWFFVDTVMCYEAEGLPPYLHSSVLSNAEWMLMFWHVTVVVIHYVRVSATEEKKCMESIFFLS